MNRIKSRLTLPKIILLITVLTTAIISVPVIAAWVVMQRSDPDYRDYMDVTFTSEGIGWVAGSALTEDIENPGFIAQTMNGGATWQKMDTKISADLVGIYFLDDENGWAVGAKGLIVNTTNGRDWEIQISKADTTLKGIYFVNKNVGFAVGETDTIIKTKNGGRVWNVLDGGIVGAVGDEPASMFSALQFIDENTGWIVGIRVNPQEKSQKSIIQMTTDGGETWTKQETGKEDILEDIFFLDDSSGWAVGENGVILHTTNGGKLWKEQDSGTIETLRSVRFVDKYTGWAVGGDLGVGVILSTNNGGKKWELEETDEKISKENMIKVFVLDKDNVWIAGARGLILKIK